ncbi:MAG: glycosyltransferase [Mariprofundales bacterium]|nr:glycosyltransferase [Mariprofundales bacterium]
MSGPILANAGFNTPKGRLKVGYLSGDFRYHAVGFFCYPIFGAHDRSRFEVFCYSGTHQPDAITNKFAHIVEHFVDVSSLSTLETAKRVYADGIDVLVDLGGHTSTSLLSVMLHRPAPVQLTYLGFASTTGMKGVDYRITDHLAEGEGAERYYTEELRYLPDCFVCFGMRPSCAINREPPVKHNGFITFGSFNNKRKMNPQVVALWSRILQQVPGSKLALKTNWGDGTDVISNMMHAFMSHGITTDQLIFLKYVGEYDDHVAAYNSIDIALDPFPYTGTTTTCEALWMGVPVVTLVGDSHASRVSYSILKSVGYGDSCAFSEDEYVEIAVKLAMNPDGLAVMRPALHTMFEYSPVARPEVFTPHLEELYLEMAVDKGVDTSQINSQERVFTMAGRISVVAPRNLTRCAVSYVLAEHGDWYEEEIVFLRRWVSEGMGVLDCNAGYGCYALSMAQEVGADGMVVAIEGDAERRAYLQRSVDENGFTQMTVVQAWSSSIADLWAKRGLDLLLLGDLSAEDLVEFTSLISDCSPLIMMPAMRGDGMDADVVTYMAGLGYAPYRLVPGLGMLVPAGEGVVPLPSDPNLLFGHRMRAELLARAGLLLLEELDSVTLPEGESLWYDYLSVKPYARDRVTSWRASSSPSDPYFHVLNAYVMAHDHGRSPAVRYGCLNAAFTMLLKIDIEGKPLLSVTLARIATELGQTSVALQALEQSVVGMNGGVDVDYPFLTVDRRYDDSQVDDVNIADWLRSQVMAQLEFVQRPSAWSNSSGLLQLAKTMRQVGWHDDEVFKREAVALQCVNQDGEIEQAKSREAIPKLSHERQVKSLDGAKFPGTSKTRVAVICEDLSSELWRMIQKHCEKVLQSSKRAVKEWLILIVPPSERQAAVQGYLQQHFIAPSGGDGSAMRLCIATPNTDDMDKLVSGLSEVCRRVHRITPDQDNALQYLDRKYPCLRAMPPLEDDRVTVCVPTYNRCTLLQRTVESVLAQSYGNVKLLIVDDASTDNTEEYCRSIAANDGRVHYHRNRENLGSLANHMHAYDLIDTDLFVFSSDDDFLYPEHLSRTVAMMKSCPTLGMVFGQTNIGDVSGNVVHSTIPSNYTVDDCIDPRQMFLDSIAGNQICWTSVLFRRCGVEHAFDRAKEWLSMEREQAFIGEGDYFFDMLMVACVQVGYVKVPAAFFSVHDESFSGVQLGGGWGMELRLRTVWHLAKIYRNLFGMDQFFRCRLGAMLTVFDQQLQAITVNMSKEEMVEQGDKLEEFQGLIKSIKRVGRV